MPLIPVTNSETGLREIVNTDLVAQIIPARVAGSVIYFTGGGKVTVKESQMEIYKVNLKTERNLRGIPTND